jgi:magnesium chelatase subunit D
VTALQVADAVRSDGDPLLAVLTDGRATGAPGAFERAIDAATAVRRAGVAAIVLDCESGSTPLWLARQLAEAMGAAYVRTDDLEPTRLTEVIRAYGS